MAYYVFDQDHEIFRRGVRSFVEKELAPHAEGWDVREEFPPDLYQRMGQLGYFGLKFPEEYGGSGPDYLAEAVLVEELCRCGAAGVQAGLTAHSEIAMPPVFYFGTEEQKQRWLVPGIQGEKIGALGITEPNAGSDVASLQTTARREGDHYLVNGSKMFITGGCRADWVVTAVRTGGPGHRGISMLVIEKGTPGFSVGRKLKKLGWRASDTAELVFEDCLVPAENLLGEENQGFYYIMRNFQWERLSMALGSVAGAQLALDMAVKYAGERVQFGRPISKFQVTRHKLADLATRIEAARCMTYNALEKFVAGEDALKETTMAKIYASEVANLATDETVQIHGGYGYMMEFPAQRAWRDARLGSIGGGTSEIMKEILVKVMLS